MVRQLKYLVCLTAMLITINGLAQQIPLYSQYYFNSFIYNPAQTGEDQGLSASLIGRRQFNNLARPIETNAFTFQARADRSGFGIYAHQDQQNWNTNTSAQASYAFHIPIKDQKTLSFGIGLSAINQKFNQDEFHLIDQDDPSFNALINQNGTYIDGSAGIQMDFGKFEMGLSSLQILNENATYINSDLPYVYNLAQHWMFNMAYTIDLGNEISLDPYMLYRKTFGAPAQTDWNMMLNWQDKWYAGVAYRDGMSFSSMLGINIKQSIMVGYSYDVTSHYQKSQLGNTHEVVLKWQLREKESNKYDKDSVALNKTPIPKVEHEEIVDPIVKPNPKPVAKPDEEKTPITKEEPTVEKEYYLIAGSFVSESSATTYVQQLKSKGIEAFLKSVDERYYVHVGKFNTREAALAGLEEFSDSELSLWIKAIWK